MHLAKSGLRVLGIAESYTGIVSSTLAGVVMRKDLRIDGVAFSSITVGGDDATDGVLHIIRCLDRQDINAIMLSGCVIAWFNIIDPLQVWETINRPVIVVTYEASEGLEEDIVHHFPHDLRRLKAYQMLGERSHVTLNTGYTVFIRVWGCSEQEGAGLVNRYTLDGRVPEPLRVARLLARAKVEYDQSHAKGSDAGSEDSHDSCRN